MKCKENCNLKRKQTQATHLVSYSKTVHQNFKDETEPAVYKESVCTAQLTLLREVIKTNQLMMYKAKVAVCSDIRTKHSTQSEHQVEFLVLELCGT